jgi:hypothetical protein
MASPWGTGVSGGVINRHAGQISRVRAGRRIERPRSVRRLPLIIARVNVCLFPLDAPNLPFRSRPTLVIRLCSAERPSRVEPSPPDAGAAHGGSFGHRHLASGLRLTVPVRRCENLGWIGLLSLGLHLEILLLFLIISPMPPAKEPEEEPQGKGSPPSIAMLMDSGTAEGVKQPTPSFAPAKVAPGEAPSMPPPPPMPKPAPTEANTAETAPAVPPPVPAPQAEAPTFVPTPTPHHRLPPCNARSRFC